MKIAVTGHRPHKLGKEYDGIGPFSDYIREQLQEVIEEYRPTQLISGMALGVDMLWAELAIKNNLPFIAAIPCANQEKKWPTISQDRYISIINNPLCVPYWVSELPYNAICMQRRNEWMVDNCDMLVAVWDGSEGGTKNCKDYAVLKGVPVIYRNPTLWR